MDTNSLEAMMQQGRPGGRRVVPVGGARAGANGRSGGAGIMDTNMMSTHGEARAIACKCLVWEPRIQVLCVCVAGATSGSLC